MNLKHSCSVTLKLQSQHIHLHCYNPIEFWTRTANQTSTRCSSFAGLAPSYPLRGETNNEPADCRAARRARKDERGGVGPKPGPNTTGTQQPVVEARSTAARRGRGRRRQSAAGKRAAPLSSLSWPHARTERAASRTHEQNGSKNR
jgi:hypothetical protein